ANRLTAFTILNTMSDMVIEKRMWFTNFEAKDEKIKAVKKRGKRGKKAKSDPSKEGAIKPPNVSIKIKGTALDNKTVADFMTRMEKSKLYSNIRLITLKQQKFKQGSGKESINLKGFEVGCKKIFIDKPDDDKNSNAKKKEKK
ncbi:PilN domain-containing protein, partial [Desulfobacterales bacterium HSG17]|nr:PilN domain-containing protein [Desulfobacterales bacterium HSG17]